MYNRYVNVGVHSETAQVSSGFRSVVCIVSIFTHLRWRRLQPVTSYWRHSIGVASSTQSPREVYSLFYFKSCQKRHVCLRYFYTGHRCHSQHRQTRPMFFVIQASKTFDFFKCVACWWDQYPMSLLSSIINNIDISYISSRTHTKQATAEGVFRRSIRPNVATKQTRYFWRIQATGKSCQITRRN